jgi:hypothetical protein
MRSGHQSLLQWAGSHVGLHAGRGRKMRRPRHRSSSGDVWDEGWVCPSSCLRWCSEVGEGIERKVASSPSSVLIIYVSVFFFLSLLVRYLVILSIISIFLRAWTLIDTESPKSFSEFCFRIKVAFYVSVLFNSFSIGHKSHILTRFS